MKNSVGIGHIAIRVKDTTARSISIATSSASRRCSGWIATESSGSCISASPTRGICLEVDSIDGVLADLAKAGIPLAREKQMGADGNLRAWIEDPDGNRIELTQIDPNNSMQTKARQKLRAG